MLTLCCQEIENAPENPVVERDLGDLLCILKVLLMSA